MHTLSAELAVLKSNLQLTDNDLLCFYHEERVYLKSLRQPPLKDQLSIHYVRALDELEEQR